MFSFSLRANAVSNSDLTKIEDVYIDMFDSVLNFCKTLFSLYVLTDIISFFRHGIKNQEITFEDLYSICPISYHMTLHTLLVYI